MKNNFFLLTALLSTSLSFSQDNGNTLTFESYDLDTNDYYNGNDLAGNIVINEIALTNVYNQAWDSWSGFAISKVQDNTTAGYGNQYASFTNGGANNSSQYGVFYDNGTIEFNQLRTLSSIQVTNTTYAAISMRDGDAYSKQFGSPTDANGNNDGTNGEDWFLLQIIPLDENDALIGDTIDYYLADYRFSDNAEDYIIDTWETIDLDEIIAKKIAFKLSSSDNGDWGMNTPNYFALDNLISTPAVAKITNTPALTTKIGPNPTSNFLSISIDGAAELKIVNTYGQVIDSQLIDNQYTFDVSHYPTGLYHLFLTTSSGSIAEKIIIE